jgi:hypothetical protein
LLAFRAGSLLPLEFLDELPDLRPSVVHIRDFYTQQSRSFDPGANEKGPEIVVPRYSS